MAFPCRPRSWRPNDLMYPVGLECPNHVTNLDVLATLRLEVLTLHGLTVFPCQLFSVMLVRVDRNGKKKLTFAWCCMDLWSSPANSFQCSVSDRLIEMLRGLLHSPREVGRSRSRHSRCEGGKGGSYFIRFAAGAFMVSAGTLGPWYKLLWECVGVKVSQEAPESWSFLAVPGSVIHQI